MKNQPLKISLLLNLQEIISVIESLPEGHSLLTTLIQKRDVLLSANRIQRKFDSTPRHGGTESDCTCLLTRKDS